MTIPASPSQATREYRPESPPGTPHEHTRVALVGESAVGTNDLYRLLRRRLLILSSIVAGGFFISLWIDLAFWITVPSPEPLTTLSEWAINRWRGFVELLVIGGSAMVLWRWPPRSVPALRLIELVIMGFLVVVGLSLAVHPLNYGFLERAANEPLDVQYAFVGRYILAGSLLWFSVITIYGALIPNTWRRCAAVVGLIGVSPLVLFATYACWLRPLTPGITAQVLAGKGLYIALAVAIAVFSSSRIEILQRQAAEARKLGQYVLRERLGAGGMGEVYRAEHLLLRRPCALKVIRPEQAGDSKNLRRFEREVQTTATLTHPNTVQIYDYGHAEDGTFYYVMEYLPGVTLEELVKRDGPLPPGRAVHLLRQICGALQEAHGRGLIHRDVKPGNVMICQRGGIDDYAKLLDFGLVLPPAGDLDGEKLTQEGIIAGTPAYVSPEQACGQENLDARSDIYSIGALAYFLLSGRPPFAGRSSVKMLAAHLYEEPEPLANFRPDIPVELNAIVQQCLAKSPQSRFPDMERLNDALARCAMEVGKVASAAHADRPESLDPTNLDSGRGAIL